MTVGIMYGIRYVYPEPHCCWYSSDEFKCTIPHKTRGYIQNYEKTIVCDESDDPRHNMYNMNIVKVTSKRCELFREG